MDGAEIGTVLPEQHEDQLRLGFRMIQNAYDAKVAIMEQELRGLRLTEQEMRAQSSTMQKKNNGMEVELVEGHQKAQQLSEENVQLRGHVSQLQNQIARLTELKKTVMSSIQDEQALAAEHDCAHLTEEYLKSATPLTMNLMHDNHPASAANRAAPPLQAAAAPAERSLWEQRAPPVQPAPVAAGPSAAPLDGKQFFRMARNSLSYEAFNEFLANIKRLNNQQQTKEETLAEARRIFGPQLDHLYREFEALLNRHAV
eukprot:gnl/TRDRNA2_/TRDRNA2_39407_c0_seq1.p1 gnl/TRDRNA2_/TRDRNA2_39407_c0~~gnl/TRDRNA2_/TRDRNA2_39407_c0_seq1.p1  ORF type:complete len:257 (-),score=75.87 gnl/TRDRNA2_/TRDRNA2_39407_c0_seq1:57-827(-)